MTRAAFYCSAIFAAAVLATACTGVQHTGTTMSPTATTTGRSYLGRWMSDSAPAGPGACGNFEWRVTIQTDTFISGVFFARCSGNLTVSGSAWGDLTAAGAGPIPVSATAGATGPGVLMCDVSIKGAATFDGDTITIPYYGTTCQGPISGSQVLQRH